ncbi:MAG TPA: PAS domain S-box protein [Burkholderiales bacterium]
MLGLLFAGDTNARPRLLYVIDRTHIYADAIVESAIDAIVGRDVDGIIRSWNPAAARLYGYSAGEAIGRAMDFLVPAEQRREEEQLLLRLRAGESIDFFDTLRLAKDGRALTVSLRLSPIRNEHGQLVGVSEVARDISGWREAERAQAYLAAIVDFADDAIISKSLEGAIQSWNRGAERIFGYSAAEAIGRPIALLIPPELQHEEPQILARLRAGERVDHYETERVAKDGRRIPVSLTVSPIRDRAGRIIGASKIARDISERKRAEAFRRAKTAELQTIIEAVPAAVLIAEDRECRSVRANRAGHLLLQALAGGVRPAPGPDVLGEVRSIERRVAPAGELGSLRRAAAGEAVQDWEERAHFPDGTLRYYLGNAVPLHNEAGAPQGAVAALIDITARVQAEEALRQADRRKDEFLAMLAHELRNPLAPIRSGLDLLERSFDDPVRHNWALQVIDRQLTQLTRIVEDLLDLARIIGGHVVLKREPVALGALVSRAIETARPLVSSRRHLLRIDLPLAEVRVHVDAARVVQALSNLLTNAAKFTGEGGTITVTADVDPDRVTVRVADNGRGIEPEMLPRMFDMFVQGRQDYARPEGGLGIGLAVVRRIAELHGGGVEAHSAGSGRGAEFCLTLPLAGPGEGRRASAPVEAPARMPPRRVLIVDDNRDAADMLAETLRLHGHEVASHYDGEGVLQRALGFRPDVVILDLGLPGRSGFDVARELRAHPTLGRLPLIALTGYSQASDMEQSRAAGLDFHLAKPVDTHVLLKLIANPPRRN